MTVLPGEKAVLAESILQDLGDDAFWFRPAGYQSVALSLIDSIYSTGNRYTGVVTAIDRYKEKRKTEGGNGRTDTPADLIDAVQRWGGPDALADVTQHWRCWPSKTAPYKADAVFQAAQILIKADLRTVEDVRAALDDPVRQESSEVKKAWLRLPGQRSGLTWTYFLMLCGVPGVKADRMVTRYVGRVLNRTVTSREAAELVGSVADDRQLSRTLLDHAIWRLESGRPYTIQDEAEAE